METVNVLCMKWGTKYGPQYVNILKSMVARHLKRPHRFICITDDAKGIDAGVEVKPFPVTGFHDFDQQLAWTKDGGWLKLSCFTHPLHDIVGKILFLDLDIVIVDELDPFFESEQNFEVIKDWSMNDGTGNTSVFLFKSGAHADAFEYFKNNHDQMRIDHDNEQEFICQYLIKNKTIAYWPEPWCVSFKYHCMHRGLFSQFQQPALPAGARIVAFHGKPNPPDAIEGGWYKWYRYVPRTEWVKEHWR